MESIPSIVTKIWAHDWARIPEPHNSTLPFRLDWPRSLIFQPDDVGASILKFPYRRFPKRGSIEQTCVGLVSGTMLTLTSCCQAVGLLKLGLEHRKQLPAGSCSSVQVANILHPSTAGGVLECAAGHEDAAAGLGHLGDLSAGIKVPAVANGFGATRTRTQ